MKITGDSMCSLCNKKIGTSVFAVYPNGRTLVHFVCFKDSQNMKAVAKGTPRRLRWYLDVHWWAQIISAQFWQLHITSFIRDLRVCQGVALRGVIFSNQLIPRFGFASIEDIGSLQVPRDWGNKHGWFSRLLESEVCIFEIPRLFLCWECSWFGWKLL